MNNKELMYKKLNALRLEVHGSIVDDIKSTVDDIFQEQLLQQTVCYTMLPPDVTLKDIKGIRNYFGEHDVTLFEHRAFSILSRVINHLETSGGNIV